MWLPGTMTIAKSTPETALGKGRTHTGKAKVERQGWQRREKTLEQDGGQEKTGSRGLMREVGEEVEERSRKKS